MSETPAARSRARMPAGTVHSLDRRSLAASHRQLAALLRAGLRVLDVGCGTGAITSGVADAVGLDGLAVGTDLNAGLLAHARTRVRPDASLRFARADVYDMPFGRAFDIVTAARVLQWLDRPAGAVAAMARVVRPGGIVLLLDYDREAIEWMPAPPPSMAAFYAAFLAWRADAGFDNAIAHRLGALLDAVGASAITVTPQPETTTHAEPDFAARAGIWAEAAATRGRQMVADGFLSEADREAAERDYRAWVETDARSMTLHLDAVHGVIA